MNGEEAAPGLTGGFGWLDWGVVLAILVGTTIVGERLAGKQSSMRDFFLGGRKLPWYAVAASIIATEISAVTYVSLPYVVYKVDGNITYLQLGLIGSFIARVVIGYVVVPAYYRREIYSPYDFMGNRLGPGMRGAATILFSLGGLLGQSARVYITAVVLEVILHQPLGALEAATGIPPLAAAVVAIGAVAVLWTLIGGIATVIWTDAILFLLFLVGIAVTLATVASGVEGGLWSALEAGAAEGKFQLLDFDTNPTKAYTFWVAVIAAPWAGVGQYGLDQLMAQRMFCCRNEREARKAIIASIAAMAIAFLAAVVGVGLWAYYRENPMTGAALALYTEKGDRVFPIFITEVLPAGLKGLVVAGVFAAAISSFDSIMAALSQTTMTAVVLPLRRRRLARAGRETDDADEARHTVFVSRVLVVVWAVLLCAAAIGLDAVAGRYDSILDLALAMASYTIGALIAGFLLAFLPLRPDPSGFFFAAPLSVMTIFAIVWHEEWAVGVCLAFAAILILAWVVWRIVRERERSAQRLALQTIVLLAGLEGVVWLAQYGQFADEKVLAWPWYIPIGSVVAFVFALLLRRPPSAVPRRLE